MPPVPYRPVHDESVSGKHVFVCTSCSTPLPANSGDMTCPHCGRVPRHGSD